MSGYLATTRNRSTAQSSWERSEVSTVPFAQRFGFETSKPITDDFPIAARVSLARLLKDLLARRYIFSWDQVVDELCLVGGLTEDVVHNFQSLSGLDKALAVLKQMQGSGSTRSVKGHGESCFAPWKTGTMRWMGWSPQSLLGK